MLKCFNQMVVWVAFIAVFSVGLAQAQSQADGRRVAAVVDGKPIYLDELNSSRLHTLRQQLFQLEMVALVEKSMDRLRKSHPKEFEVPKVTVTEDQAKELYTQAHLENKGPFKELKKDIISYLEGRAKEEAIYKQFQTAVSKGYIKVNLSEPPELIYTVEAIKRPASSQGSENASVYIVEFSDFQCPFCSRVRGTLNNLVKAYGDKIYLTFRHLPLGIHDMAQPAAIAAECAGEQGQFWAYHDQLFDHQEGMDVGKFDEYAKAAGVKNLKAFGACKTGKAAALRVKADEQAASALGITSTPSFIIGRVKDGKVVGVLIEGSQSEATFRRAIDQALAQK